MALQLDDNFLKSLGITGLDAATRDQLLAHIQETLEVRVGTRLADAMSEEQLDEFEKFLPDEDGSDEGDDMGALKWLEENFPEYPKLIAEELEKLKLEIKKDADKIIRPAA